MRVRHIPVHPFSPIAKAIHSGTMFSKVDPTRLEEETTGDIYATAMDYSADAETTNFRISLPHPHSR